MAMLSLHNPLQRVFSGVAATLLLPAASSQCFALQRNMDVSRERAKELGVSIRSTPNGVVQDGDGTRIDYQFKLNEFLEAEKSR